MPSLMNPDAKEVNMGRKNDRARPKSGRFHQLLELRLTEQTEAQLPLEDEEEEEVAGHQKRRAKPKRRKGSAPQED